MGFFFFHRDPRCRDFRSRRKPGSASCRARGRPPSPSCRSRRSTLRVSAPRVCLGAALLGVERPGLAVGGKLSPADTWVLRTHKMWIRSARRLLLSGWAAGGVYGRHLGRFYTSSMQIPHLHLNVPANFYGLQLHFTILRYSFLQRVCSDKRGLSSGDIAGIC